MPTRFNKAYERAENFQHRKGLQEAPGIGERYSEIGRLFLSEGQSADEVSSVLPPLVAIAGRINFAVGDGLDVVVIRDEIGVHFLAADETKRFVAKSKKLRRASALC